MRSRTVSCTCSPSSQYYPPNLFDASSNYGVVSTPFSHNAMKQLECSLRHYTYILLWGIRLKFIIQNETGSQMKPHGLHYVSFSFCNQFKYRCYSIRLTTWPSDFNLHYPESGRLKSPLKSKSINLIKFDTHGKYWIELFCYNSI